jgi:hypothetical protein
MKSQKARLQFYLWVECPDCGEEIDLEADGCYNDEGQISRPLFSGEWDKAGFSVVCDCGCEFEFEGIEY